MKIIHIGDLHLGKSFHKLNLINDQRHVLNQILELMQSQKANLIIAGDVYDSANPSLEAQELFLDFCKTIKSVCQTNQTYCWITVGNHDSARRLTLVSDFLAPEITIVDDCTLVNCDDVTLCLLPFVKPASAEQKFDKEFTNYSDAFNAYLANISDKEHTVLVAHQSFENCTTGHSEVMTFF